MAGNPRDHAKKKGFWDGGDAGHGMNRESGGRTGGFPGERKPTVVGIRTDLEYPEAGSADEKSKGGGEP
jgi:hypothetical protein